MNVLEVNTLCSAMIKFNMIPKNRVSRKDKEFYSNMRRSLRENKPTNKTQMLGKLCISLIADSNQINDQTSEYNKEFTDIYNSYDAKTVEDLVIRLHQINRETEQNRQKNCEEKYNEKIEYDRVISMKNKEISTLNARVRQLEINNLDLEKRNSDLIDKYDSDSSDEEIEIKSIYDTSHVNDLIVMEAPEIEEINYNTDSESCDEEVEPTKEEIRKQSDNWLAEMEANTEARKQRNRKKHGIS